MRLGWGPGEQSLLLLQLGEKREHRGQSSFCLEVWLSVAAPSDQMASPLLVAVRKVTLCEAEQFSER